MLILEDNMGKVNANVTPLSFIQYFMKFWKVQGDTRKESPFHIFDRNVLKNNNQQKIENEAYGWMKTTF